MNVCRYRYSFGPADMVALAVRTESIARMGLQHLSYKGVTFHQSLAPQVAAFHLWCDGHRLQQAVGNFMSNAVRHVDAGGQVRLCIMWMWREEPQGSTRKLSGGGSMRKKSARKSVAVAAGTNNGSGDDHNGSSIVGGGGGGGVSGGERDDGGDGNEGGEATQVDEEDYEDEEADARAFLSAPEHARPVDVTIQVWNSGSYLPPGSEEAIFRPYVQLANTAADSDNPYDDGSSASRTGIGLSITREIVCSGHNGIVRAWSDDTGTTFSATLRVFAVPADPRANAAAAAAARQARIDQAAARAQRSASADAPSAAAAAAACIGAFTTMGEGVENNAQPPTAAAATPTQAGAEADGNNGGDGGVAVPASPATAGTESDAHGDEFGALARAQSLLLASSSSSSSMVGASAWAPARDVEEAEDKRVEEGEVSNQGSTKRAVEYPIEVSEDAVDVLYVEDSQLNRKMLQRTLTRMGVSCELAEDGRAGVEWTEAHSRGCRLVLVDRSMPVMDGLEATRRIKEIFPDVPVVGLTGDAQQHEIASFVAAGAEMVLTKPVSKDALEAVLRRYVGYTSAAGAASGGGEK
jgi:CheY-like chemotaxis protein